MKHFVLGSNYRSIRLLSKQRDLQPNANRLSVAPVRVLFSCRFSSPYLRLVATQVESAIPALILQRNSVADRVS